MSTEAAIQISAEPCALGHVERDKRGECKTCRRERERAKYAADPEYYAAKRRREYERRKAYYASTIKKWRKENPGRVREQKRAFYYRHKERLLPQMRERVYKKLGMPEPTRPRPENCELCGKPEPRGVLHLDHCHTTNRFRGWLCSRCNLGLGQLGDSVEALRAAVAYLEKSEWAT